MSDDDFEKRHGIPSMPDNPPRGYDISKHLANASNMTAEQKLAFANKQAFAKEREKAFLAADALPLTDDELKPYSRLDFEKLRPELRPDVYNRTMAARRRVKHDK
jgi:hypothetical protein